MACSSSSTSTSPTSPSRATGSATRGKHDRDAARGQAGRRPEPRARRDGKAPRGTRRSSSATRYSLADISLYAYTHVAGEGGFDLDRVPGDQRVAGASPRSRGTSRSTPSESRARHPLRRRRADAPPHRAGAHRSSGRTPPCSHAASRSAARRSTLRSSRAAGLAAGARSCPTGSRAFWSAILRQRCLERGERGLRFAAERHEPALEARDVRLVAVEELDQQVDARGLVCRPAPSPM